MYKIIASFIFTYLILVLKPSVDSSYLVSYFLIRVDTFIYQRLLMNHSSYIKSTSDESHFDFFLASAQVFYLNCNDVRSIVNDLL